MDGIAFPEILLCQLFQTVTRPSTSHLPLCVADPMAFLSGTLVCEVLSCPSSALLDGRTPWRALGWTGRKREVVSFPGASGSPTAGDPTLWTSITGRFLDERRARHMCGQPARNRPQSWWVSPSRHSLAPRVIADTYDDDDLAFSGRRKCFL